VILLDIVLTSGKHGLYDAKDSTQAAILSQNIFFGMRKTYYFSSTWEKFENCNKWPLFLNSAISMLNCEHTSPFTVYCVLGMEQQILSQDGGWILAIGP
jgi:hypothetical protein